jgi:sugar phosphate isomerase/epimerase
MTRRELLASAMAVAIARGDTASKTSHLAVINDEVGLTPQESISFAKQYGIQWVELRAAHIPNQPEYCEMLPESALRDLKKSLSDNGLSVTVLDSSLLKCALPGTVAVKREDFYVKYFAKLGLTDEMLFRDRLDLLKRAMDAAHILGTPNIRIFAFWRVQDPSQVLSKIADVVSEMSEIAHKASCRLVLENESSTCVGTSTETAELFRLVRSPGLGLNWDPQNSAALNDVPFPEGYAKLPKNRIVNVHVKAEGLFGPKKPLDWGAIMLALLKDGYAGKFSLETHRGHGPENVKVSHQCMEKMIQLINS